MLRHTSAFVTAGLAAVLGILSLSHTAVSAVVCVKFSNLIMVSGDAGGEPPASVAAVAAG